VLIVGGYGAVGQRIARLLIDHPGGRVVIAGRRQKSARRVAHVLGSGVTARFLDVADSTTFEDALDGVALAIVCVDTQDLTFAHACVTRSIHVIDITATTPVIERLGFLNDLACAHGAVIVTSVGLAPGLTGLMATACANVTDLQRLDIHVLFGLGERHGAAAMSWLVDRLSHSFDVTTDAEARTVWPFQEASRTVFPVPFGERATYRFEFPEPTTLPKTLGIDQVNTWTTFTPDGVARALSWLARRGAFRALRYRSVRRLSVGLLRLMRLGSDRFAASVDGTPMARDMTKVQVTVSGSKQSQGTAVVAAETARRLLAQTPPAGVHQLDQLYDLEAFEPVLARHHMVLEWHGVSVSPSRRVAADNCTAPHRTPTNGSMT